MLDELEKEMGIANLDEILYKTFDSYYQEITVDYNENEIINIYNRCAQVIDRIKTLNFESIFNINNENIKQKNKRV